MSQPPASLIGLGTACPPHTLDQHDVTKLARHLFADRFSNFDRMEPVFRSAGIDRRQSAMPMDWYTEPRGWPERSKAYLEAALDLFIRAGRAALDDAGVSADQVDTVVTVSSTGIATPSLEARAMADMGFRQDVQRVPVFGLGCAGGATGLALASRLARTSPDSMVLLVVVELCTLSFRSEDLTKADIVATALFGDGAAACVLTTGRDGFARVKSAAEHSWPDTLAIMGWRIEETGLGVIFDRAIPPFARDNLRPAVDAILDAQGLVLSDIDHLICHPGGTKVIQSIETALSLADGALVHERAVLLDHGNMSAPTVLFVLDRARRDGLKGLSFLTALGPGFTLSTVTLEAA